MGLRHLCACAALLAALAGPADARAAPGQEPPPPPPADSPVPPPPAPAEAPPPAPVEVPPPAAGCQTSLDCGLAAICVDGRCEPGCRTDRDCEPRDACDPAEGPHGACRPRPAAEPSPLPAPSPAPAPEPSPSPSPALSPAAPAPVAAPPAPAASPASLRADPLLRPPPSLTDEAATLGAVGRLGWRNRVAVLVGADLVGKLLLLRVTPGFNLSMDVLRRPLALTVGIPLRFQLVDAGSDTRWAGAGRFRTEDWNRAGEWLQFLQDFTWGGPGHDFLFRLTQFDTHTLGRGALVRRHDPNVVIDTHHVSVALAGFSDWAGGEAYLDDLAGPDVLGARAYLAPLAFVDRKQVQMRTLQVGASVVADVSAPLRTRLDALDDDDDGRRWGEPLLDPATATPRALRTSVLGWGFDLGLRAVDTGAVQWDTWVDYSLLQSSVTTDTAAAPAWEDPPAKGVRAGGFTWGNLLKVDLGPFAGAVPALVHGLRFRLEYRNHDPRYLPGYFDLLYGVQRFQYGRGSVAPFDLATAGKAQRVLGRAAGGTRPNGMLFEFTYLLGAYFAASFGFEFNDRTPDNALFVHLEVPDYKDFQFSATWHRRNASGAKDLFRWLEGDGVDLFVARARYTVAGIFGICLEGMTPFGMNTANTWENQWQVGLSIDLGWSYAHRLPGKGQEGSP